MDNEATPRQIRSVFEDVLEAVRTHGVLSANALNRVLATHNRLAGGPSRLFSKKQLAPYYLNARESDPHLWESWNIDEDLERNLLATVQMKPRRTASGVATITVITKPHPCRGNCVYCPNDVSMPKSYLREEPACQRAQRCFFDPYLQVASRLSVLERMGHATDKVELIVLGGSFTDYPEPYQIWFVCELFRALNDAEGGCADVVDAFADMQEAAREPKASSDMSTLALGAKARLERYSHIEHALNDWQDKVNRGEASYNDAVLALYGPSTAWGEAAQWQTARLKDLETEHTANENAAHRVVGLVVETRPNALGCESLTLLRRLGCTKLQMGVQTLDEEVAARCMRPMGAETIRSAFDLARAFGFKSHAHFMANLPGATPDSDRDDYRTFVNDPSIAPDEVKLYPCALIGGTGLEPMWEEGAWEPYAEDELVALLADDVIETPEHTRISRMIRDFSSGDILAGNKKTNLRQMVEARVASLVSQGRPAVREIRMREVATDSVDAEALRLDVHTYRTANSTEHFLQWVVDAEEGAAVANRIAGFLRLSLPVRAWVTAREDRLPIAPGEAMIREVHVYGTAARLHAPTTGAQHQGLGRALVERACSIAAEAGYDSINVISAIGTRNYYRGLGFADAGLYLRKSLESHR